MISAPLTNEDKKILIQEITQLVPVFIFIGIILTLVSTSAALVINKSTIEIVSSNRTVLIMAIVFLSFSGLITFAWIKIRMPLKDLLSGKKLLSSGIVRDKTVNENYGSHGNIAADLTSQPKLVEYFLIVDNHHFPVEKNVYDSIQIGDRVVFAFSYVGKKLIKINREENLKT